MDFCQSYLPTWFTAIKRAAIKFVVIAGGLLLFAAGMAKAQITNNFRYDEISVSVHVSQVGTKEISSVIKGNNLYLSIQELFDFLQIKNTVSADNDSVYGFFIHPLSRYLVEKELNRIFYSDVLYNLTPHSLIRTESGLYLKSDYFEEIFGLTCTFNFRSLSVKLVSKEELPAIKLLKQQQMRKNLAYLKNGIKADTIISKTRSLLKLGMADWTITRQQSSNKDSETRLMLTGGAYVMGGDANFSLYQAIGEPFQLKQQRFNWHYVSPKSKLIRQVNIGRLSGIAINSISGPTTGVQITNAPVIRRRTFGTYRLSRVIEPNWTVELYINNMLVNYTTSDASGLFTFEVPLFYGNSTIVLKAYGPYGEERIKEETINIPFNFLPEGEFNYTLAAGLVDDEAHGKYSKATFNYGFSKRITLGAGVEYLSTLLPNKVIPFANASFRLGDKGVATIEHNTGVANKAVFSFRLLKDLQLDASYANYVEGQRVVNVQYLESRKIGASYFFHAANISGFTKASFLQLIFPKVKSTRIEWIISGSYKNMNANITTVASFNSSSQKTIYSNLVSMVRLPAGITLHPQVRYDYVAHQVSRVQLNVEKRLSRKAVASIAYIADPGEGGATWNAGFRYDFSFAHVSSIFSKNRNNTSWGQSVWGSVAFNSIDKKVSFRESSNVGKGAVTILSFLDINNNGKRDANEPKVYGLKVKATGGRVENNRKDSTVSIWGLSPYTDFVFELGKTSFDNIAWQIKKPNIQVNVEPNHFKLIEVPVTILGEVSGMVYIDDARKGKMGQGRIIVNIYKEDTVLVAKTLSEPDGYFSYLGLAPGNYKIQIDEAQMAKLNLCCPEKKWFDINATIDGDIVGGIEFSIKSTIVLPEPVMQMSLPAPANTTADTTDQASKIQKTGVKTTKAVKDSKTGASKKLVVKTRIAGSGGGKSSGAKSKSTSTSEAGSAKAKAGSTVPSKESMLPEEWKKFMEFMKSATIKEYAARLLLWFTLHH